jgi:IMP dehydrogenase/GMP reductase
MENYNLFNYFFKNFNLLSKKEYLLKSNNINKYSFFNSYSSFDKLNEKSNKYEQYNKYLTFDDVGLVPLYSNIKSRMDTNISINIGTDIYNTPFIPANMDSVIGNELASICNERNAMIIFHRFAPIEQKLSWLKCYPNSYMSIGLNSEDDYNILYNQGCRKFCIDIAHGHTESMINLIKKIRNDNIDTQIIAGNVCTYNAVHDLANAGANIIKIGVGPGAACTTRIMTGVGVPQFSAVLNCVKAKEDLLKNNIKIHLIADGGIKEPRDACLCIALGVDGIMMGSIFAKTYESAAKKINKNNQLYARYRGQASSEFMDEYFGSSKLRQPEGISFDIKIEHSANYIFDYFEGGLRSSLTYLGSSNLSEYKSNATFFETTSNYMYESHPRM